MGGTSEEIKEAFEGFDAYCDAFYLDAQGQFTYTPHTKGSNFSKSVGIFLFLGGHAGLFFKGRNKKDDRFRN